MYIYNLVDQEPPNYHNIDLYKYNFNSMDTFFIRVENSLLKHSHFLVQHNLVIFIVTHQFTSFIQHTYR